MIWLTHMHTIIIICAVLTVVTGIWGLSRAWKNSKDFKQLLHDANNGKYDDLQHH